MERVADRETYTSLPERPGLGATPEADDEELLEGEGRLEKARARTKAAL